MKPCSVCGEVRPADAYSPNRGSPDGLQAACKPCRARIARERRARRPEERHRNNLIGRADAAARGAVREAHREEFDEVYAEFREDVPQPKAYRMAEREMVRRHQDEYDDRYHREKARLGL